jgi:hypothetical protein
MGSSFTSLGNHGFWARDTTIELWLYLLADEVRKLDEMPEWLREASDNWTEQATVGMTGCVSACLDEYASTPERAALVLTLAERALASLRARGSSLPVTWLNSLGLGGPGSYFTGDSPADPFLQTGDTFVKLLRGEITWTAPTSPVI